MTQACPNCGSDRPDRFCSHCGQNDRDYMRGLWSVVYEFFREMFELDSRLFRTLKSLLFKPGHLSSEFSRNRRAAYMSPVRLYLFTSFLFFLVLSISAGGWLSNLGSSDADVQIGVGDDPAAADSALAAADSALATEDSALATEDSALAAADGPLAAADGVPEAAADSVPVAAVGAPTVGGDAVADEVPAVVDSALAVMDRMLADRLPAGVGLADSPSAEAAQPGPASALAAEAEARARVGAEQESPTVDPVQLEALRVRLLPEHTRKVDDIMRRPGESVAKQVIRGLASLTDPDERASGVPGWLIRYGRGLVIDLVHDPQVFLRQAIGNLPITMFFLLPVFAVILAVCHLRRKRFFVEHLVFGMHIHTFAFLMLAAALLVPDGAIGSWAKLFLVVVSPFYVLIAMRRFYGEGWGMTLVKGFVVWNLYSCALFPGLLLAFLVRT